jgi:aspartate--ammonia ligase
MLMMGCAHIGEVQSSVWDKATLEGCAANGIRLL